MQDYTSKKRFGIIFPDDGAFPYELCDHQFITSWLADRNLEDAEGILYRKPVQTPESLPLTEFELCGYWAEEEGLLEAARELRNKGCRSVVFACTSASFFGGIQYAKRQAQFLSEAAGASASSTALAFLAALDVLGAKRVDVLSPYDPEITDLFVKFLSEADVNVGRVGHMTSGKVYKIDCKAEVAKFSSSLKESGDPILIPCTAVSSLRDEGSLERIAGRPVLTANRVTLWHALVLAGASPVSLMPVLSSARMLKLADSTLRLPL
ncbi:MAG: hypothetical protein EOQ98_30730 [Mesorhizobium sp.]|uniref:aspartate racemase/maleate isomerase family protein n=1 Tax=Mesorhizobium sp. TaxID=1871066 RepID=UPI000FE7F572|nr:hypothetical protein [Mesorhizobium sp.]RWO94421.1 MAG: hypothetical protein EOQ98_30730 [Mesorhizobium sp.]TIM52677.1 MAG: hypothetical protein E5Y69_00575 [Mesorhizobium sp.]